MRLETALPSWHHDPSYKSGRPYAWAFLGTEALGAKVAAPANSGEGRLLRITRRVATKMAKQAVAHAVDLEPIDRLEEKITRLVTMISELRTAQARAQDENVRLGQELEDLRARLAEADATSTELLALRDERDIIRSRVSEMLQQLEAL